MAYLRKILLWTACLGLAAPVVISVAVAQSSIIQNRIDTLLKSGRYQTQLPRVGQVRLDQERHAGQYGRVHKEVGRQVASSLAQILEVFAYIAGGVLVVILLVVLRQRLNREPEAVVGPSPSQSLHGRPLPKAMASLTEAERLASLGEYSAAAHILLLHVIEQLRQRMPVDDALTTRELIRAQAMPDASRQALDPLVRVAEYAYFGGYEIGREDFERCRRGYARFTGLTP